MHRFLVSDIAQGVALLPPEEAAHAVRVLRMQVGDEVCVSDGCGRQWSAAVASIEGKMVRAELRAELPARESPVTITLYQGLPKAEKLELITQKATELGFARLVPVRMARSIAKWGASEALRKRERAERIAQEAVKQCGRAAVPRIETAVDFDEALADMKARSLTLVPWEEARGTRLRDVYEPGDARRDIGIVVGPEGGMEEGEVRAIEAVGGRLVTLGPRILRAETAAITCVALVQQLWGDV